tara:strand:- start:17 stop:145 length:129 start_codon:yes stop_codon:yes gene_type:complete
MRWGIKKPIAVTILNNAAEIHDGETITDMANNGKVVRNNEVA